MKTVIDAVTKNYANFKGRASRKEYWLFVLATAIISVVIALIKISGLAIPFVNAHVIASMTILDVLFQVFIFIPSLAIVVRRLHDIGKSGWFYLIAFIPIVGWILIIIWACRKGQDGSNRFGSNPLEDDLVVV